MSARSVHLGLLYHDEFKNNKKAEKYYLMASQRGDLTATNGLAWLYFEEKREKQQALAYARQIIAQGKNVYTAHTVSCIYLWNDLFTDAIELAETFMYDPDAYNALQQDILLYLMLLLAKEQYRQVTYYFESPGLDLPSRFRPFYYALLTLLNDPNARKRPPELAEPVKDILTRITQMAKEYA